MKFIQLTILLLLSSVVWAQPALPITSFDYALPENNVSPVSIGMGALNITNSGDLYGNYSNPALIGANEYNALLTSFRLKSNDDLTFWEAAQVSNALKAKQFKYFTLVTKQAAWTYQPVANVHIVESLNASKAYRYYDYQLDKVQVSLAAKDESWQPIAVGINVKYLAGRLVHLISNQPSSFIDDKVKGFSTDIGATLETGSITIGLVAYDILSRLYWENYPSKSIQPRVAMGVQYGTENLLVTAGLQGKLSQSTDTTYHFGFQYLWDWDSSDSDTGEDVNQGIVLRLGMYSHDFYGTSNIHYTFGTGYNYNVFRFDFSLNNKGMKLKDSEYLFSLGVGLP